ncbi:hypothetical protein I6F35_06505 [Bradyrhizobium sp. BRP22]|uniref:hypothetical protein n=1 Tax=Bradyrhizobium sp. BRP22 TaxID=2793821 RepID=UPI001CD23CE7|nr:hypothetical protein [Bradyrhizobium sp. BRP22]MCA1452872.1 hypothetical protein [Bradyrhizobium sp. BRP22]
MPAPVLALDLASVSGWACGEPGGKPLHGSIRFAAKGASHEAIFANAMQWAEKKIVCHKPKLIVWEAPLPTTFKRGNSTIDTTSVLFGLPAVIGAIAYRYGIYDIRKAETRHVRQHFIGCNPKRARAKPLVVRKCRAMGWSVEDDNEADALATWSYMCSLLNPRLALAPTPLFGCPA